MSRKSTRGVLPVNGFRVLQALCLAVLCAASPLLLAQTSEELLGAAGKDADWLTYGHGYANQRYSGLTQIHRGNVSRLVPKWIYQTGVDGTFQTNPIVFDGTVYLTTPRNSHRGAGWLHG